MQTVAKLEPLRFVGIDWAAEEHAVCVLDDAGRKVMSFKIAHSRDGFEKLVKKLATLGPAGQVPVAIERPDGRLVDALLEAGHPVAPVSPNAIGDNSRHASPWAADIYQRAIARGCDHPHAVRILARAWIRVIYRCWIDHVPYDPARHGAARRLAETANNEEVKNMAA